MIDTFRDVRYCARASDKPHEIPGAHHIAPDVFRLDRLYLHVYFLFTEPVAVDSGRQESQNDLAQW